MITFWRPSDQNGYLGQWYESKFILDKKIVKKFPNDIKELDLCNDKKYVLKDMYDIEFTTAEKFMMMGKASLFKDYTIFDKMCNTDNPKDLKNLGRKVKNFDVNVWNFYSTDIVIIGNYLKFTQNRTLMKLLIETDKEKLVEGSPFDRIWGVGLRFDNPDIYDKSNWKGENLLGKCLMKVRRIVKKIEL